MKYLSILLLTLSFVFNAEWIDLGSSNPEAYVKRILSTNSDNIRLEFSISGYYQTLVETPNGNSYIIDAGNGASILQEGAPDLDKITAPIMIPNQASMSYEIISTEYIDFKNIIIAFGVVGIGIILYKFLFDFVLPIVLFVFLGYILKLLINLIT